MALNLDLANEGGAQIIGDGGETDGVLQVKTANAVPALVIARSGIGSSTIAAFQVAGSSMASGALIGFTGGFISATSIVLTTVANVDYVIPVQVGLQVRYLPLFKAAAVVGAAAF